MERKFGLEIEFINASPSAIAQAITAAGIECHYQSYNHNTCNHWKIVNDASCGYELVSPPLQGEAAFEQIKTCCEVLQRLGAKVNVNCGLHVHLDANDLTLTHIKNVIKYWVKFEDVFDAMMPKSRRANNSRWCQSNLYEFNSNIETAQAHREACLEMFTRLDRVTDLDQLRPMTRYLKLNLASYWRHRTIEVRHHSGTLEAEKIINWITLLQQMFKRATEVKDVKIQTTSAYEREWGYGLQRMDSLFITLRLTTNKALTTFFRNRARKFAKEYGLNLATR